MLKKFKTGEQVARIKSADAQKNMQGEDSDYDNHWKCDGTHKFANGCKSGQTDFDEHIGTAGYSCPDDECDFDLCEMCIRWCLYCEENQLDFGWSVEEPAEDPKE